MGQLILTDANGAGYTFPNTFITGGASYNANTNIKKYLYANGGKQTGDGFYNNRIVTVEGMLSADTPADFETVFSALQGACIKGGTLTRNTDTVNRYVQVKTPSIDYEWISEFLSANITINFVAEFPFWQDTTEIEDANVMTGIGSFTVDASGSSHIMTPVIEIAADQSADLPSVKLLNASDGGLYFEYNNPIFFAGSTLVVDCKNGTIKLDGNDAGDYMQEGSTFLRLQPVNNTFNFEGNACTVTVKYRKVYL